MRPALAMRAVSVVQVLEEKGREKRHSPQPFSENTSNIPLQNSINNVLRFHSPAKGWKWYNHHLKLCPATLL